jgi:outer membrane protein OmpA-like peptidoglycan-associated protein
MTMSNSSSWHEINDPGVFTKKVKNEPAAKQQEAVVEQKQEEETGPEVRLSDPQWAKGPDGFAFNKKALVSVKVDYLKTTVRKRVNFELFVESEGEREDLKQNVEGFEKDGRAEAEVTLYYGDKYNERLKSDPSAACKYIFKATHSTGEKPVESEPLEMPQSDKISVDFVEIADVHFHHNCALPCLDEKGDLVAELLRAFSYAKDHAGRELVVEGHADRSGDKKYNLQISKRRAEAIKALLENDADLWMGVISSDKTDQKLETEDYQQTLKSLSVKYGWPCDPGAVDNKSGPKTQSAVKSFQSEYNSRFPSNEQLTVDGTVGPKTWLAIFHTLRDLLEKDLKDATLDPAPTLAYGYPDGNGIYPCGESSPVTDLEKSEEDRRVELVFYVKDEWSPAVPPAAGRKVDADKDPVSEKEWKKTPVSALPPPVEKKFTLKIARPEKTPHKQFVNLTQDDKEQGPELKIIIDAAGAADGKTVAFEATAGDKNSKRNDPQTGLKPPGNGKLVEFVNKKARVETKTKDGKAECTLACGLAGGDTFTIDASIEGQKGTVEVTNWRRLWYQKTRHKDAVVPSMATSEKQLKDVFIEFFLDGDVTHANGAAGSVIIGNHNTATYHAMLKTAHKDQCVNEIFCDEQYDGLDSSKNNIKVKKTASFSSAKDSIDVSEDGGSPRRVFDPPIQTGAKFFLSGSWINMTNKTKGTLTDDSKKTTDDIGLVKFANDSWVEVDLPKNAGPAAAAPVDVTIEVTAASGPWGGDGGSPPHNLIVIDTDDTMHSQCILHELGHLMNMVPMKDRFSCPPGFSYADHTHAYLGMGGAGSHCSYKIDTTKSTDKLNVDGRCIMFHRLNNNCELIYCPECAPFVEAQSLKSFGDLKL